MNRRRFLVVASTAAGVGLSGCLGGGGDDDGTDDETQNGTDSNGTDDETQNGGDGNGTDGTGGDGSDDSGNQNGNGEPPDVEASFDVDPAEPTEGETIVFDASGSVGDIAEYRWDFTGDGETDETGETVTRTFEEPGEQNVTLEVETTSGETDETMLTVFIMSSGDGLSAAFSWEVVRREAGEQVTFDGSNSQGDIAEYRWDFTGNGEFDERTSDPLVTYTLETSESRLVTLEISDGLGGTDTLRREVLAPPEVVAAFEVSPESPDTGEQVTFDAGQSEGDISEYRWDFTGNGVDIVTEEPIVSNTYEIPGSTTVRLQVETDTAAVSITEQTIFVNSPKNSDAVDAVFDWTPTEPAVGEEVIFNASGSVATDASVTEYRWDFESDGEFNVTTTGPTTTHVFETTGTVPVTLEVTDEEGRTGVTGERLQVSEDSSGPTVDVSPEKPEVGEQVTFDASAFEGVVEYQWDFNSDGEFDTTTSSPTVTHTFDEVGSKQVIVALLTDDDDGDAVPVNFFVVEQD